MNFAYASAMGVSWSTTTRRMTGAPRAGKARKLPQHGPGGEVELLSQHGAEPTAPASPQMKRATRAAQQRSLLHVANTEEEGLTFDETQEVATRRTCGAYRAEHLLCSVGTLLLVGMCAAFAPSLVASDTLHRTLDVVPPTDRFVGLFPSIPPASTPPSLPPPRSSPLSPTPQKPLSLPPPSPPSPPSPLPPRPLLPPPLPQPPRSPSPLAPMSAKELALQRFEMAFETQGLLAHVIPNEGGSWLRRAYDTAASRTQQLCVCRETCTCECLSCTSAGAHART